MGCLTPQSPRLVGMANLQLVQDPAADALLESNPFALLVGMLLDQ